VVTISIRPRGDHSIETLTSYKGIVSVQTECSFRDKNLLPMGEEARKAVSTTKMVHYLILETNLLKSVRELISTGNADGFGLEYAHTNSNDETKPMSRNRANWRGLCAHAMTTMRGDNENISGFGEM